MAVIIDVLWMISILMPFSIALSIRSVCVVAPNGCTTVIPNKDIVIDRTRFDKYLIKRAKTAGVKVGLGQRVQKINFGRNGKKKLLIKNTQNKKIQTVESNILIGADGPNSLVAKSITNIKPKFLTGIQAVVEMPVEKNTYSVYFGKEYPGFFGWIVPESNNIARIGVAGKNVKKPFNSFLKQFGKIKIKKMQGGLIPIYNPNFPIQNTNKKIYLVGDSALQVKATTGGGLYPGLKATEGLVRSINNNTKYKKEIYNVRKELFVSLMIRKMLNKFNNKDYNKLIKLMNDKKLKKVLIHSNRDHALKTAILAVIKKPQLLGFIKHAL